MKPPRRWFAKVPSFTNRIWKQWLRPTLAGAAIIFPIKSALADMNWVPTGSMKPTILEGDLIWVNKLAYDLKVPFTLTRLGTVHHDFGAERFFFITL